MSAPNGSQQRQQQMTRRAVWKERASRVLTRLRDLPPPVKYGFWLTLLVLALLLAGCATNSAQSSFTPANPAPPPTTLSERSETFSSSAQRLIQTWRSRLIELTQKP